MHLQTHFLSGWVLGNYIPAFGPRERMFCMIAAVAPDFDGLSLLGGWECYYNFHHALGHNLLFAVVLAVVLAAFSKANRILAFAVYFGLIHLHFLMDLFGSGDDWGVEYWRPFNSHNYLTKYGWDFYSWQNLTSGALLIVWTLWIIYAKKRTFFEAVMPKLDRQIVELFRKEKAR